MGRAPCCDKATVKRGPWSPEEDATLKDYIEKHGTGGNWIALPQKAGLKRCGKSCRLRWLNYLRPNIKHGDFTDYEDRVICTLYASIGSRWSIIAGQLPGRTDNDIKNYWNTKLKKKLMAALPPLLSQTHRNSLIPPPNQASSLFFSQLPHQIPSPTLPSLLSPSYSFSSALHSPSNHEINFEIPVPHYQAKKVDSGFVNFEGSIGQVASNSAESKYNFSSSSSTSGDQSASYDNYYPYRPAVEEKENLLSTSIAGGGDGWAQEAAVEEDHYGFEQIKKLISTNNDHTSFLFDENNYKVGESTVYY